MRRDASTLATLGLSGLLCAGAATAAHADEPAAPPIRAVGVTVDLLPVVISALDKEAGGALQVWYGHGHWKARLVGAHLAFPDALSGDGLRDKSTNVVAAIVDHVWGEHLDGWWVGAGVEYWANRATSEATGAAGTWSNLVATAGGGYIWRFYGNAYLEPWGAAHLLLTGVDAEVGGAAHHDQRVTGEVSLKIGVFWEL